ncbi:MAG: uracil-DNA glycosylase, partial [Bacteroidales bacterium]
MNSNPDIKKVIRQHAEMAEFFSGGLTVKTLTAEHPSTSSGQVAENAEKEIQLNSANSAVSAVKSTPASSETIKELEELAEQTRKCRKCELGSSRTNAVPGEGNPSARIMFVGEAPGADEDAQARPFVGRAGQLLDRIIAACGLKRQDVWIGNILKCRPPDNRDPRPEEIIACLPYLQRQIELINPEVIVALGAHAAKTLLNTPKAIGQLRGIFHEYQPGIGKKPIKLMATFHPAYLLRNYSDENRRKVW